MCVVGFVGNFSEPIGQGSRTKCLSFERDLDHSADPEFGKYHGLSICLSVCLSVCLTIYLYLSKNIQWIKQQTVNTTGQDSECGLSRAGSVSKIGNWLESTVKTTSFTKQYKHRTITACQRLQHSLPWPSPILYTAFSKVDRVSSLAITRRDLPGARDKMRSGAVLNGDNLRISTAYLPISDHCRVTVRLGLGLGLELGLDFRLRFGLWFADCCIQTAGQNADQSRD